MAKPREIFYLLKVMSLPLDIVQAFHALLFRRDHNNREHVRDYPNWQRFFRVFDAFCKDSDTFAPGVRFQVVMLLLRGIFASLAARDGYNED